MNSIASIRPMQVAQVPLGPGASAPASLLPGAAEITAEGMGDAMSLIYALISKQSQNDVRAGTNEVNAHESARKAHIKDLDAARERQKKADGEGSRGFFDSIAHLASDLVHDITTLHVQDVFTDAQDNLAEMGNSPKFWSDLESGAKVVGEVAAAVGAAVATAVTLGAAAPAIIVIAVVGLSVSAGGMLEGQCHYLEKLGMDEKTAGYFGLGMTLTGAALTLGAGSLGTAAAASDSLAELGVGVAAATDVVSVGATTLQGGAHIRVGDYKGDAQDAAADMKAARQSIARNQRLVEALIDGVKETSDSHKHALGTLQGAMKTNSDTLVLTSMRA